MPPGGSDDENDSCVFFGTPLVDLLPEDAKFSVKPKRVEDQIVTDERGRQRFHGAFTGGFSAGYFNTVGSKEGWAPSTFKSSRSDRKSQKGQRAEDFMDEEDFAEHGIAPKSIQVKSDYKDEAAASTTRNRAVFKFNPKEHALDDLIRPSQNTIGVRMLKKMGWREGQGIGPRIKRKLRRLKAKISHEPGRKLYGVALPSESESDQDDERLEDEYLVSTYSTDEFQFEVKEDVFGLGYKRLDVGNLLGKGSGGESTGGVHESPAASLLFPSLSKNEKKINKKGFTGQAFGVGDFEDDEDMYDVYKHDSIESYDFELGDSRQKDVRRALNKTYGFNSAEDSELGFLKNFIVANKKLDPPKVYPAPQVPAGFNLRHRLERKSRFDDKVGSNVSSSRRGEDDADEMTVYIKSVSKRAELLGEEPIKPDSVLDLVSSADRDFLKNQAAKSATDVAVSQTVEKLAPLKSLENEKIKKTKRYESYVGYIKKNYKDPYSFVDTSELTEWEKVQEKDEFERRYSEHLQKIESLKKDTLKFVSLSKLTETNQEIETNRDEEPSASSSKSTGTEFTKPMPLLEAETNTAELTDAQKAAKEKKYGDATRTVFVWKPHPVVCKRFNVKNPFPDAKEFGTVKDEKRKTSIKEFNMLTLMTAASRFDRGKTKSLFEELNADVEMKPGLKEQPVPTPSVKIVEAAAVQPASTEAAEKLEFDTKIAGESSGPSILSEEPIKPLQIFKKEADKELETTGIDIKNNIYLQERPSFDIFKEIFENEDEQEEETAEKKDDDDEKPDEDVQEIQIEPPSAKLPAPSNESKATVVKSSFDGLNINLLSKYLGGGGATAADERKQQDDYEVESGGEKKSASGLPPPAASEKILFKKLVENLAAKKKGESSESDDSSSSDSSSEEIVYEEVSVSPGKKSSHSNKKKKKKKHKKKSKKSHKKSKK